MKISFFYQTVLLPYNIMYTYVKYRKPIPLFLIALVQPQTTWWYFYVMIKINNLMRPQSQEINHPTIKFICTVWNMAV